MAAKKKTKAPAAKRSTAKASGNKARFAKAKAAVSKASKAVNKAVNKAKKAITRATGPQAIPSGFHSLTPSIVVKGAKDAMEFYKKAFGATPHGGVMEAGGMVMHADR